MALRRSSRSIKVSYKNENFALFRADETAVFARMSRWNALVRLTRNTNAKKKIKKKKYELIAIVSIVWLYVFLRVTAASALAIKLVRYPHRVFVNLLITERPDSRWRRGKHAERIITTVDGTIILLCRLIYIPYDDAYCGRSRVDYLNTHAGTGSNGRAVSDDKRCLRSRISKDGADMMSPPRDGS